MGDMVEETILSKNKQFWGRGMLNYTSSAGLRCLVEVSWELCNTVSAVIFQTTLISLNNSANANFSVISPISHDISWVSLSASRFVNLCACWATFSPPQMVPCVSQGEGARICRQLFCRTRDVCVVLGSMERKDVLYLLLSAVHGKIMSQCKSWEKKWQFFFITTM